MKLMEGDRGRWRGREAFGLCKEGGQTDRQGEKTGMKVDETVSAKGETGCGKRMMEGNEG